MKMTTRTKTIETPWRLYATVLALGAAISLLSVGLARSETAPPAQSQALALTAPLWR
jgi:hypothetical protein